jgi:tetratricopeptide (TPR) repeat protein
MSIRQVNAFVFFKVLAILTLSLVTFSSAGAQGVGSSRGLPSTTTGIHVIQGKVFDALGKPLQSHLRVRLESPNTGTLYASTDQDGTFIFNSLEAGDYRLTVEGGANYEDAFEHPSIYREASPNGVTRLVTIYMRPKISLDPEFDSVPKEAIDLYKKGMELERKGETKKAVEEFNKAIGLDPNFGPAQSELGTLYLKLGDPGKAATTLESAVKLIPENFQARLSYGIALLNQKKFPEAEEQLAVAVKKNPNSATAHMYLGIALMSQKKLEDAEKELNLSVASNSNEVAVAHKYLGGLYWGKREYQHAADELETYLKLMPKAPDAERTKAAIKELRGKQ